MNCILASCVSLCLLSQNKGLFPAVKNCSCLVPDNTTLTNKMHVRSDNTIVVVVRYAVRNVNATDLLQVVDLPSLMQVCYQVASSMLASNMKFHQLREHTYIFCF